MICAKLKFRKRVSGKREKFIQERLINGKVGFFNPIKKNNLKTEI